MRRLTIAVLLAAALSAHAQDPAPGESKLYQCKPEAKPVDCYLNNANAALLLCRLQGENGLLALQLGRRDELDRTGDCIKEAKDAIGPQFSRAKVELAANAPALGMLKDHYAAWLTSIDDTFPGTASRGVYKARTDTAALRVKELANRVRVER
jgi:hypothetical protein